MIDSHCHLDQEPIYSDLKNVILRSKEIGVKKILSICTTKDSFKKITDIVEFDTMIYGTCGIHPHETSKDIVTKEEIIKNVKNNKKIIAIGESGLDFYYNHSDKKDQTTLFLEHIEAAQKTNLPLIVHTRSAENETYNILKDAVKKNDLKILIHCFTGTRDFAFKLIDLGAYISASGVVTFKKSQDLASTFKDLPNDKILVETDSPYLAPEPLRGKSNEPSYIVNTVKFLSKIKKVSFEDFSTLTTKNFLNLFGNLN